MKFNISYPTTGAQKTIEVDDERKIRNFIDKRLSAEVDGEALGDQFKGYVFKIAGGFDKQGFTMKQGVLVPGRVRLLLGKNTSCYKPRRDGERKRKSVRGCIVSNEISVLNLVIVKKGAEELPGLTDKYIPRRLGPKRASKIRKLFNLSKEDDVRKYVIRRELVPKAPKEGEEAKKPKSDKKRTKAPKIQRLVTPLTLQRKRHRVAIKKRRAINAKAAAADYAKLLAQRAKEARASVLSKRRSVLSAKEPAAAAAAAGAPAAKKGKPAAAAAAAPAKGAAPAAAKPAAKAAAKPSAKAAAKPAAGKPAAKPAAAAAAPAAPKGKPAAAKPAAPAKTEAKPAAAAPAKPKAAKAAKK